MSIIYKYVLDMKSSLSLNYLQLFFHFLAFVTSQVT